MELTRENLTMLQQINSNAVIQSMINDSFMIEFGVIKEVVAEGVVNVIASCADKNRDAKLFTCVYGGFATSELSIVVEPKVDDKVIVLFPRRFLPQMFKLENNEIIVAKNTRKRGVFSGIALPFSQITDEYKNILKIQEDGTFDFKTENDLNINVNKDNEITIDTTKAKVTIDKDGNVSIDAMDGKLTLKNNKASLFDILKSMLQTLNTNLSTSGSPAKHIVDPQQFSTEATDLNNLMQ